MKHNTWFKRLLNPILRKIWKIEITPLISDNKVIGYGIRKQIKGTFVPNKGASRTESPTSDLIINHNGKRKTKFELNSPRI